MKRLRRVRNDWEYELQHQEAVCLRTLIRQFPLLPATAAKISRTELGEKVAEREQLLNESLAMHREELKQQAQKILLGGGLARTQDGWRLRLNPDDHELLLQLFNDIRVESWRMLGEPESLESLSPAAPKAGLNLHNLIHLAGYFESKLLKHETDDHSIC